MREYALYELLLFFVLYSVLGWIADRCVFALRKRKGGRGICKGPYMPLFGAAALLVVIWSGPAARAMEAWLGTWRDLSLPAAVLCGAAAGGVCAVSAALFARLLCGSWLIHVSVWDPLLWMAGGVLTVMKLQPLLENVIRQVNPWVHLIFLCAACVYMAGDWIDGVAGLLRYRKKGTISEESE